MNTPDINFIRHRKFIFKVAHPMQKLLHQLGIAVSGAAFISAIAGYGALLCGRDIPTALTLGATGSVGLAINIKLKGD